MAKKSKASKRRRKNLAKISRSKRNKRATESIAYEPLEPKQLLATLIVTSAADDGSGGLTLREALVQANNETTNPGLDTIQFADSLNGQTITTNSQLVITSSLNIEGPGADQLAIDGGGTSAAHRVFLIDDGTDSSEDVSISGLTISGGGNGMNGTTGAGISSNENLTLDGVSVVGNQAVGGFGGGIRSNLGSLVLRDSTVSGNSSRYGGGIYAGPSPGVVEIINSTISGNSAALTGGGISSNFAANTTIRNSTFTGNRSDSVGNGDGAGGGIDINGGSELTLHNSIVAGNFNGATGNDSPDDVAGAFQVASSHNLIGDAATSGGLADGTDGNIVGNNGSGTRVINTVLNTTLVLNGGTTATHALVTGSPAINNGDDAQAIDENDVALVNDQRGNGFTRVLDAAVDIGAVESGEVRSLRVTTDQDIVADDGLTSLREAINFANDPNAGANNDGDADGDGNIQDTVTFADGAGELFATDQTILMLVNSGVGDDFDIEQGITIQGPTDSKLTIDAQGGSRIFDLGRFELSNQTFNFSNLTLVNGDVTANRDGINGGAIRLDRDFDHFLNLKSLVLSNNSANEGGAIYARGFSNVNIDNSSIVNNESVRQGGAISLNNSNGYISNSTISGNTSGSNFASAIFNYASTRNTIIALNNVTLADNTGDGIDSFAYSEYTNPSVEIRLANSVVSGNTGDNLRTRTRVYEPGYTATATVTSLGNNISDDSSFGGISSDMLNTDPLLAPLDPTTLTHALLPSSPAIDAGNDALAVDTDGNPLQFDQNGRSRFVGTVDIGSVEDDSFLVTTNLDEDDAGDGLTSLREAIDLANNTPGDATIRFDIGLMGETITLGGSQLEITDSITIEGFGVDQLTISANDASRVFVIDDGNDSTEIDVTIRGLTIRDGNTTSGSSALTGPGAGIQNSENLTLEDVAVRSNRSDLIPGGGIGSRGGGLAHTLGNLVVTASTFADNSSLDSGGIDIASGSVEIVNSTFYDNTVRGNGGCNSCSR